MRGSRSSSGIPDFNNHEELASFLKAISVPGTDLPGLSVYHGTIAGGDAKSIISGPKNMGRGFGGSGLYVAIQGERSLAEEYAASKSQTYKRNRVMLEGTLNPDKKYRVARIQLVERGHAPDIKRGIFPPDWSKNQNLQDFMHSHFDIIEVTNASKAGYAIESDRYLVIHERAGSDVIIWDKQPLRNRITHTAPGNNTLAKISHLKMPQFSPVYQVTSMKNIQEMAEILLQRRWDETGAIFKFRPSGTDIDLGDPRNLELLDELGRKEFWKTKNVSPKKPNAKLGDFSLHRQQKKADPKPLLLHRAGKTVRLIMPLAGVCAGVGLGILIEYNRNPKGNYIYNGAVHFIADAGSFGLLVAVGGFVAGPPGVLIASLAIPMIELTNTHSDLIDTLCERADARCQQLAGNNSVTLFDSHVANTLDTEMMQLRMVRDLTKPIFDFCSDIRAEIENYFLPDENSEHTHHTVSKLVELAFSPLKNSAIGAEPSVSPMMMDTTGMPPLVDDGDNDTQIFLENPHDVAQHDTRFAAIKFGQLDQHAFTPTAPLLPSWEITENKNGYQAAFRLPDNLRPGELDDMVIECMQGLVQQARTQSSENNSADGSADDSVNDSEQTSPSNYFQNSSANPYADPKEEHNKRKNLPFSEAMKISSWKVDSTPMGDGVGVYIGLESGANIGLNFSGFKGEGWTVAVSFSAELVNEAGVTLSELAIAAESAGPYLWVAMIAMLIARELYGTYLENKAERTEAHINKHFQEAHRHVDSFQKHLDYVLPQLITWLNNDPNKFKEHYPKMVSEEFQKLRTNLDYRIRRLYHHHPAAAINLSLYKQQLMHNQDVIKANIENQVLYKSINDKVRNENENLDQLTARFEKLLQTTLPTKSLYYTTLAMHDLIIEKAMAENNVDVLRQYGLLTLERLGNYVELPVFLAKPDPLRPKEIKAKHGKRADIAIHADNVMNDLTNAYNHYKQLVEGSGSLADIEQAKNAFLDSLHNAKSVLEEIKIKTKDKKLKTADDYYEGTLLSLETNVKSPAQDKLPGYFPTSKYDSLAVKDFIHMDEIKKEFIKNNEGISPVDLTALAVDLTSKATYTDEDVAKISGVRHLILSQAHQFQMEGKIDAARKLLAQTENRQYFLPGNIAAIHLGNAIDNATQGDKQFMRNHVDDFNRRIATINNLISSGGNPLDAINALLQDTTGLAKTCNDNKEAAKKAKIIDRKQPISHATYIPPVPKKAPSNVSVAEWSDYISTLAAYAEYLTKVKNHYAEGNQPKNLELSGSMDVLHELHSQQSNNLGYYREAAEDLKKLQSSKPDLDYTEDINRFYFLHNGQVIDAFVRPVQEIVTRFVDGCEPSWKKSTAKVGLEVVNLTQTVVPNAVALGLQGIHEKCLVDSNMCMSWRSFEEVGTQLCKDVTTLNFNGAMIASQAFLKAVQYLPLEPLVLKAVQYLPLELHGSMNSQKMKLRKYKNIFLRGSHLSVRAAFTGNAGFQLYNAAQQVWSGQSLLTPNVELVAAWSPLLALRVARTGLDLTSWGYHRVKKSRGEAIENPKAYITEDTVGTSLDSISAVVFLSLITGGLGWIACLGAALGTAATGYTAFSSSSKNEATGKALEAAMANFDHHYHLKSRYHYATRCAYRLILGDPSIEQLKKVAQGNEILLAKDNTDYYFYFTGDKNNSTVKQKITVDQAVLAKLSWPTGVDSSTGKILVNAHDSEKVIKIAKIYLLPAYLITHYIKQCEYRVKLAAPTEEELKKVTDGRVILFTDENSKHYIYFKSRGDQEYERQEIRSPLDIFEGPELITTTDSDRHDKAMSLATLYVVDTFMMTSLHNIESLLRATFGGLKFNDKQLFIANSSRVAHLHYRVRDSYDLGNYAEVIRLTKKYRDEKKCVTINEDYRIPPYLAWQIIVFYRLMVYAESEAYLLKFRKKYQTYSELIHATDKKEWYDANWNDFILMTLNEIVKFALKRFVVAANQAETLEAKKAYLSNITKRYNYCGDWITLLTDIETRFLAAFNYYLVGDMKNAKKFIDHISDDDFEKFMKEKKNCHYVDGALIMHRTIGKKKYTQLLQPTDGNTTVSDDQLYTHIINLIVTQNYTCAAQLLKERDFSGKHVALAFFAYNSSNKTNIAEAFLELALESNKDMYYWRLLYCILLQCLFSVRYGRNITQINSNSAWMYGLVKICAERLQTFPISFEEKQATSEMIEAAECYLKDYVSRSYHPQFFSVLSPTQVDEKVNKILEEGHRCMRDEAKTFFSIIEGRLAGMSYDLCTGTTKKKYFPLEAQEDEDSIFHVLGTTREDAIRLLKNHVRSEDWYFMKYNGWNSIKRDRITQRKDVIDLLLDYLDAKKKTHYVRGEETIKANVKVILADLDEVKKTKCFIRCDVGEVSLLDALSLLRENNIRIYVANAKGELECLHEKIHDDTFPTIDILHTSSNGFTRDKTKLNHYTKLAYLPTQLEELKADKADNVHYPLKNAQSISSYSGQLFNKGSQLDSNGRSREEKGKDKISEAGESSYYSCG